MINDTKVDIYEDKYYFSYDESNYMGFNFERNPYRLTKITEIYRLDGILIDKEVIEEDKGTFYAN
jgi:hypothetical protein